MQKDEKRSGHKNEVAPEDGGQEDRNKYRDEQHLMQKVKQQSQTSSQKLCKELCKVMNYKSPVFMCVCIFNWLLWQESNETFRQSTYQMQCGRTTTVGHYRAERAFEAHTTDFLHFTPTS